MICNAKSLFLLFYFTPLLVKITLVHHMLRDIYKSCYVEENVDDMQKEEKEEVSGLNNFSSLLLHNIDFLFLLAL